MRLPIVLAAFAVLPAAHALEPLNSPVPLLTTALPGSDGQAALDLASAQRAQSMGFPSAAATLYRSLLSRPGADQPRLALALCSALLDDGDVPGAAKSLEGFPGPRTSPVRLRQALIAAYRQHFDSARSDFSAVHPDELPSEDRSWYAFLQGMIADSENDPVRAMGFYQQAVSAAVSTLQRARFLLAEEQVRLKVGPVSRQQLETDRHNFESYQGQKIGYGFAREYAIALNASGRSKQAIELIQNELRALPLEERAEADHFRLLQGLISGPEDSDGRHALFVLLSSGSDPDRQRVALQLLVAGSAAGFARAEFRQRLDELISEPGPHPILESLLLCRASLALGDKNYSQAEDDAHSLLERFPGSSLKSQALAILAGSAWEQRRYRTAADYASKARAEMPPGLLHAQFGVLVAEAWFRAADFRSAAGAYAGVIHEPPSGVAPGLLMFQRVQSEINAAAQSGVFTQAESVLDELEREAAFDAVDRWEAEWNLSRALEGRKEIAAAYARVNRLLLEPRSGALPPELRARMAWLQARLSFDSHRPEETLRLSDAVAGSLEGLSTDLKSEIASNVALLRAQASFELGREQAALDILQKLRSDYPRADAAVYSYIVEADHFGQQDKVAEAQRLLTRLADDFPLNYYAPYALYQAALQAERLGQDKNLDEAYRLLETVVSKPWTGDARRSADELTFYARLRQGDLLRKMNQFPQAQQVYESLVNNPLFSQNPDSILAQLALAECHNAQSANDPSHAASAERIFEDLLVRVDAPPDVRVEAGYGLGDLLVRRGSADKAQAVWWNDVIDPFLVHSKAPELGSKGRWWMARTLLHAAELYERQGRIEEAKSAWLLIVDSGLPGASLAKERLDRFHLPGAAP